RLEPMREAKRPEVSFLHEVVRLGRVSRQIDGKVVQRIEVLQRLPLEIAVGHHHSSNHRAGYWPARTVCSSASVPSSSRIVAYSVGCSKSGATSASGRSTNERSARSKCGTCRSSGPLMTSSP